MNHGSPEKHVLNKRQRTLLVHAVDRILPRTDSPGALDAGCDIYILRALAGPYAQHRSLYRVGLAALDHRAQERFGDSFENLAVRRRDAVLRDCERGRIPEFPAASGFFSTLWRHTMEGFFGEPEYGGNRDLAGWRLVKFPGHRFGYPDSGQTEFGEPQAWPGGIPDSPDLPHE